MGIVTYIEDGGRKTGLRVGREEGRMFGNRDRDRRWWEEDREVGRMFGNRDRDRRWWLEDMIESWEGGRKDVWE